MNDQATKLREKLLQKKEEDLSTQKFTSIAIMSGKGGVGKSNFSLNFSISIQQLGYSVLLIDFDLGMANIDVLMGKPSASSIIDLFKHSKNFDEVIQKGPENLSYITGGSGLTEIFKLEQSVFKNFLTNLHLEASKYDFLIFDMGAGMSENNLRLLLSMDEILLVTTCEPTSITDAYAALKLVTIHDQSIPISVIVNKAFDKNIGISTFERLNAVSKKFLKRELFMLGYIPDDRFVTRAVMEQTPFILSYPRCLASKTIKELSSIFIKRSNVNEDRTEGSFVKKLFHFFFER